MAFAALPRVAIYNRFSTRRPPILAIQPSRWTHLFVRPLLAALASVATLKGAIDRCAADFEPLCNFGGAETLSLQLRNFCRDNRWLPTLVNAGRLGLGDALQLPFASEIGFEFCE